MYQSNGVPEIWPALHSNMREILSSALKVEALFIHYIFLCIQQREFPIPEQFKTIWDGSSLVTESSKIAGWFFSSSSSLSSYPEFFLHFHCITRLAETEELIHCGCESCTFRLKFKLTAKYGQKFHFHKPIMKHFNKWRCSP